MKIMDLMVVTAVAAVLCAFAHASRPGPIAYGKPVVVLRTGIGPVVVRFAEAEADRTPR
ncbi:MAG: hypothetical protein JO329_03925 [Planctomycetaceae bacterium]|nr:hypothetical protein [Planctomycetaceae bacterium]MBV8265817.1 hypothetical protein [Planctomycetaceae bacterium]